MTQRIEPFNFWNMTQRWTVKFLEYDDKNWTLFQNIPQRIEPFSKYDSKNWTFFNRTFSIWLKECKKFSIWLEELNPIFDLTYRIDFWKMSQIIEPFLNVIHIFFSKKSQRIEPFFSTWLTELNLSLQQNS